MTRTGIVLRAAVWLSILAFLFFSGTGVLLLNQASDGGMPAPSLRVEEPIIPLGNLLAGVEIPVRFRVTNLSSETIKLLGVHGFCTDWGCVYATGFPQAVAPHSSATFSFQLRASPRGFSGDFTGDIDVFTEATSCQRLPLRIMGRVLPVVEL